MEVLELGLSQLKGRAMTCRLDTSYLKRRQYPRFPLIQLPFKLLTSYRKVKLGANPASGTFGNSNLGRPWGDYARVVFQNSDLGNVINPVGWQAWSSTQDTSHVFFAEYNNANPAWSSSRVSFATKLTAPIAISTILSSTSWIDSGYLQLGPP